jgi:hypothetical protein
MSLKRLWCQWFGHSFDAASQMFMRNGQMIQPLFCRRCGYKSDQVLPL